MVDRGKQLYRFSISSADHEEPIAEYREDPHQTNANRIEATERTSNDSTGLYVLHEEFQRVSIVTQFVADYTLSLLNRCALVKPGSVLSCVGN